MQMVLFPDSRMALLRDLDRRLHDLYGRPGPYVALDPVSQLVMGLIGGRTKGEVSAAAFLRLKRRFETWEALRDAPVRVLWQMIEPVTYADVKAPRLQAALRKVTEREGELSLAVLEPLSVPAAFDWLEGLPGVGRKTAATVLNFSTLRKPALVIDTHHLRILRRLGWVRPRADISAAYDTIAPLLPADWGPAEIDTHHQLLKQHGQEMCRTQRPLCRRCPLADLCPTGQGYGERGTARPARAKATANRP